MTKQDKFAALAVAILAGLLLLVTLPGALRGNVEVVESETTVHDIFGRGAGREETRRIATETTEAVEEIPPSVSSRKTDTETSADAGIWETVAQTETETEPETAAVMYYEPETEAQELETESPSEVAEFTDYCPMPLDHHAVLCEVCETSGVPYGIAMALIYTESRFNPYAVNPASGCYGYCQLHPAYFPSGLSPEDNIRVGIGWLGELIAEHGDIGTALTVYAIGHDNGSRWYASVIFERAQEWGYVQ